MSRRFQRFSKHGSKKDAKRVERDDDDDEDDLDAGAAGGAGGAGGAGRASSSSDLGGEMYVNKQRCLVLSSRGPTAQFRHLLDDVRKLLPHHKKEVKLDARDQLQKEINMICEVKSCNSCIFFEYHKHQDLFMWVSKTPQGPSAKFHVLNIHTIDELKLTGNSLLGSRPVLSFDKTFDTQPHYKLLKEMFTQVFGTPLGHPKSKPFVDHVMTFSIADDKILFRNYQIIDKGRSKKDIEGDVRKAASTHDLLEIGPRFVLNLVKVFSGSFGGQTLFANANYQTPNRTRQLEKKRKGAKFATRQEAKKYVERERRRERVVVLCMRAGRREKKKRTHKHAPACRTCCCTVC